MNRKGMTLIEILIVLAIIAGVTAVFINRVGNRSTEYKKTLRKFTLIAKNVQSKAKLFNSTYRIVIYIGDEDDDEQAFWVEKSAKTGILFKGESAVQQAIEKNLSGKEDDDEDDEAPPPEFTIARRVFKKIQKLPQGLRFKDVETFKEDKPITSGYAYIYFLPHGLADESVVHFTNGEKQWTINIHPLTAKSYISAEYIQLKDIYK